MHMHRCACIDAHAYMYTCVCVHACVYMRMRICICACTRMYMRVCITNACMRTRLYAFTHACTHINTCMCVHMPDSVSMTRGMPVRPTRSLCPRTNGRTDGRTEHRLTARAAAEPCCGRRQREDPITPRPRRAAAASQFRPPALPPCWVHGACEDVN